MNPIEQVETDLRAGRATAMSPAVAREWHLGAWAYYTAAPDSPLRRECALDFAAAWTRYRRIYAAMTELSAAWGAAGIDATVLKGFALAQLAYPHPALRFFGDVDVYVRASEVPRALAALPGGWRCLRVPGGGAAHEFAYLKVDGIVAVDLHVCLFPLVRGQEKRMAQLLECRVPLMPEMGGIRSLAPVDLAVIGLAVNRGWGGDHWRPKAHDYLDLTYLRERCAVSESAIEQRARELRLSRTWNAYARACNPYRNVLRLERPRASFAFRLRNDLAIVAESRHAPPMLRRLLRAPAALRDAAVAIPTLLAVLKDTRRQGRPASLVNPARWPALRGRGVMTVIRGVRWSMRLLGPLIARHRAGPCVIRSITLYRLLAAQGLQPEWVCGFRRTASLMLEGHAWVELDGCPVAGFGDEAASQRYVEAVRIKAPSPR